MPEGPEAHTMARKLNNRITGMYITSIDILDIKHSRDLENLPLPCLVFGATAYGKRPIFETERGYIMTFLCMHGRWLFKPANHTRIVINLENIFGDTLRLHYDDKRSQGIGFVQYLPTVFRLTVHKFELGPDLLIDAPDTNYFCWLMRKYNSYSVAEALLLPQTTCTIGNYLKSEILYYAQINPFKTVSSCSDDELARILYHAVRICRDSLSYEGFTMKDYLKPDGSHGGYKCSVYGRDGQFDSNGYTIIKSIQNGRSTYWVREIQF